MQPLFHTDHQNFPTHHWYRLLDPSRTTFSPLTSFRRHPRSPAAIRTVPLASGRPALSWNSERLRGRGWLTPVMCSNITPSDWTFRSLRPPSSSYICKILHKFHNQFYLWPWILDCPPHVSKTIFFLICIVWLLFVSFFWNTSRSNKNLHIFFCPHALSKFKC